MNSSEQFNQMLRQALSPTVEPSEELNQKIINRLKENYNMKPVRRKKLSVVLIAAAIALSMSVTAFAAWHYLNSSQVAEHFGDKTLARAFEAKNAVKINKSIESGDYNLTLLGVVSGKDLSDFEISAQTVEPDRTYAVVSIAKKDGSKMPTTQDEEYGKVPFFISPLIKGQKPWLVNIASMNGGYSETVINGVMYRLIECDGVEIFADRGLYLCVSTSNFYDVKAFKYDENTGELSPNTDYKGANALFDLPLDIKKADPYKADKYLEELLNRPADTPPSGTETNIDREKELANGIVIPESIKEVTYDKDGFVWYEYKGHILSFAVSTLFEEGQIGTSKVSSITEEDGKRTAVQFSRNAEGVITGRALILKSMN